MCLFRSEDCAHQKLGKLQNDFRFNMALAGVKMWRLNIKVEELLSAHPSLADSRAVKGEITD